MRANFGRLKESVGWQRFAWRHRNIKPDYIWVRDFCFKVLFYDVRQYAKSASSFPPHHDRVEIYLNRKEVRQALHATRTPHVFKECTDPPYNALKHQDGLGVTKELVALLNRQVPLLFFNGVYDMIW